MILIQTIKKIILNENKIRKKLIIFEQIIYDNSLICIKYNIKKF